MKIFYSFFFKIFHFESLLFTKNKKHFSEKLHEMKYFKDFLTNTNYLNKIIVFRPYITNEKMTKIFFLYFFLKKNRLTFTKMNST